MSIWSNLTPQHQKYVLFSITMGAAMGMGGPLIVECRKDDIKWTTVESKPSSVTFISVGRYY